MSKRRAYMRVLLLGTVSSCALLSDVSLISDAHAQSAAPPSSVITASSPNLDLGSVLTQGSGAALADEPGTAPYQAPSSAPLNSLQPTSVVNQRTILKNFSASQGYSDYIKLTPSVSSIEPNGPGLMENVGLSIRGLQDGQFNVTWDGIPVGDSNDFTHHTTSFFMGHDIGQTIVDRGPGTAETVGDATFGGTVSIRTKDPLAQRAVEAYGGYGSFNTGTAGGEFDSGPIQALNGATLFVDAEHLQSDGAKSFATQERTNILGKMVIPLGENTTLTGLGMFNRVYQNPALGATLDQIRAFGPQFAYTNDPHQQNNYQFNNDHITSDMEYLDLASAFGDGWKYDGKVYTYAYYHHDLNGDDPNGQGVPGQLSNADIVAMADVPNQAVVNGVLRPGDVPGQNFKNNYRSFGTIQRIEKDFRVLGMASDIKAGVWFDNQVNTRAVSEVDISAANAPNTDPLDANGGAIVDRDQRNTLDTFQPFGQLDIHPVQPLLITGGLKYAFFRRGIDALVNQGTGGPLKYSHNYDALLPSAEARYKILPNLAVYAQVAKGFLAPNLNYYYTNNVRTDTLKPQQTWNYQVGFSWQTRHIALGGDAYQIQWLNYVTSSGRGPNKIFYNQGAVFFKGLEGEATYSFDNGLGLFTNAGLNKAYYDGSHAYVPQAPQFTANFGILYDKYNFHAALVDQLTGGEYDSNGGSADPRQPGLWYHPYNIVNLSVGYTWRNLLPHLPGIDVKLNLDNLSDQKQVFWSPGTTAGGTPLYYTLPGISAFATVSVPISF